MNDPGSTRFAAARRRDESALLRQIGYFRDPGPTRALLDAVPSLLAVLNRERQIVFANRPLLELLGAERADVLYGLRPGEAMHCEAADAAPAGCGTDETCSTCGAVLAILAAQRGAAASRECRVNRRVGGELQALDLRVWVTPLRYREEEFSIFAVSDVSEEKRRRVLERLFYHDILNVAGSIRGCAELLQRYPRMARAELFSLVQGAAQQVIDEVEAQRLLVAAETGTLRCEPDTLDGGLLVAQVADLYRGHPAAAGREVVTAGAEAGAVPLVSDRGLAGRILGNMLKNALEAVPEGCRVTLGCRPGQGTVEFWVHNPGTIPREVQLQIFRRSFSTKGEGRGLGTYGMRLLGERLGGEVSFLSSPEEGTVFRLRLPAEGFRPAATGARRTP